MSLDLSSEGVAFNTVKVANTAVGLGAIVLGTFDGGDPAAESGTLLLELDNSGTPVANIAVDIPIPSALPVVPGTELVVINDTNGKRVNFTDPNTGIAFNYANRIGESLTLIADGVGDRWIMKF